MSCSYSTGTGAGESSKERLLPGAQPWPGREVLKSREGRGAEGTVRGGQPAATSCGLQGSVWVWQAGERGKRRPSLGATKATTWGSPCP